MKICFITDSIFSLGGIQRVVSVIASELAKDYDVDIICTKESNKGDLNLYGLSSKVNVKIRNDFRKKKLINKFSSKIIRIINEKTNIFTNRKYTNLLTKAYYPKEVQNKFLEYLNKNKYDVVIGVAGYYSLLLGIINDKLRTTTVGWQHSSYEAYFKTPNNYSWNKDIIFDKYLKKIDKYIVLTIHDKHMVDKRFQINSKKVYNPLSFNSKVKSSCEEKVILYVGRLLTYTKGIDLLLKSFQMVNRNYKDWKLCIVGEGPDKSEIIKNINSLKLNSSVILKPSTNNIQKYYLSASIFVSPSRWEGFGLVITEAMECGLPVISFANSGPKEIINRDNINGILVECEDIDKLAEQIINLIESEEKRKLLSRGAIERAKDFNMNVIVEEWKKIIEN